MRVAIEDLKLQHLWIIYPDKEEYALDTNVTVLPISEISVSELLHK